MPRPNSISKGNRSVSIAGETRGCWSVLSRAGTMGDTSTWHCKASCCGRLAIITYRQLKNCPAMCQDCNRRRSRAATVKEAAQTFGPTQCMNCNEIGNRKGCPFNASEVRPG